MTGSHSEMGLGQMAFTGYFGLCACIFIFAPQVSLMRPRLLNSLARRSLRGLVSVLCLLTAPCAACRCYAAPTSPRAAVPRVPPPPDADGRHLP